MSFPSASGSAVSSLHTLPALRSPLLEPSGVAPDVAMAASAACASPPLGSPIPTESLQSPRSRTFPFPLRILVAEDSDIPFKMLEKIFRNSYLSHTYILDRVVSGEGALEKARKEKYDLMLLDTYMGSSMKGHEAAEIIRNPVSSMDCVCNVLNPGYLAEDSDMLEGECPCKIQAHNSHVPIFSISERTGSSYPQETEMQRRSGMDGSIPKPFSASLIQQILTPYRV